MTSPTFIVCKTPGSPPSWTLAEPAVANEHFVRGAVVMVKRVNAVAPRPAQWLAREQFLNEPSWIVLRERERFVG